MIGIDLLLVSHSLNLGALKLGFLHFKKVLYPNLASMLAPSGYNVCNTTDTMLDYRTMVLYLNSVRQ